MLTVVIDSFGYGHLADHCIESVIGQSKQPDKILFVDDGWGGIGIGHNKKFTGYADPSGKILHDWIGNAAKDYERLCFK